MSCVTVVPQSQESERKPATRRFRGSSATKAVPEVVSRQAAFALLTFELHDNREDALHYLHTHCDTLNGRPIDIAGATAEGHEAAVVHLRAQRA